MKLVIVKIDQKIFEGELKKIIVPALAGDMEILPGHAPFLSPLKGGVIKYTNQDQKEESIEIKSGFVEVNNSEVVVIL